MALSVAKNLLSDHLHRSGGLSSLGRKNLYGSHLWLWILAGISEPGNPVHQLSSILRAENSSNPSNCACLFGWNWWTAVRSLSTNFADRTVCGKSLPLKNTTSYFGNPFLQTPEQRTTDRSAPASSRFSGQTAYYAVLQVHDSEPYGLRATRGIAQHRWTSSCSGWHQVL